MHRAQMGLDIFGIDVGSALTKAAGQTVASAQTAVVGDLAQAALQSQQVQSALTTQAQQATASTLAAQILTYKYYILGGVAIVGGLLLYRGLTK